MDRESFPVEQLLAAFDTVDFGEPVRARTLVIHCGTDHLERVSSMLHRMYVEAGFSDEIAHIYIYGSRPPEPERPDPIRVALAIDEAPAQEALRSMARSFAESIGIMSHFGSGCTTGIRAISRLLVEEQAQMQKHLAEEAATKKLIDFGAELGMLRDTLGDSDQPQSRRRGKKKRGHNSDRDRVICKAGYC